MYVTICRNRLKCLWGHGTRADIIQVKLVEPRNVLRDKHYYFKMFVILLYAKAFYPVQFTRKQIKSKPLIN